MRADLEAVRRSLDVSSRAVLSMILEADHRPVESWQKAI
jgi:hypothetical protein